MKRNTKLAISIPTYNRANFLDYSLKEHIPMVEKYGIPIYVYDNASSDNTNMVVEKWQKQYPFLIYHRYEDSIGALNNIVGAMKKPKEEYVWLIGDTYKIPEKGINSILDDEDNSDFFVFNLKDKVEIHQKIYVNRNDVLKDLSGVISCLSCTVFNSKQLAKVDLSRFKESYYPHTCIVFENIAFRDFKLYWVGNLSITKLDTEGLKKSNWSSGPNAIDVGVEDWLNFALSLPQTYSIDAKLVAAKSFGLVSELLTIKGLLWMRANQGLNFNKLIQYRNSLKICLANPFKFNLLYLICLIPSKPLKFVINLYLSIKGK